MPYQKWIGMYINRFLKHVKKDVNESVSIIVCVQFLDNFTKWFYFFKSDVARKVQ